MTSLFRNLMTSPRSTLILVSLCCSCSLPAAAPIIQPGAPGEQSKTLTAEEAIAIASFGYSPADVRFMQDMIPHHQQALEMSELVTERTNRQEIIEAAGRIKASQGDEINFMQKWLADRNESSPEPGHMDMMHTHLYMAGMASAQEMDQLSRAEGVDFDRLFLTLMIRHHEGALEMVENLLEQPGSAYDPLLFEFTNDVSNDQTAEIERMNAALVSLSEDPRAKLEAGLHDAGQAIWNMRLVAALPKPPGFYDPDNPTEIPAVRVNVDEQEADQDAPGEEAREDDSEDTSRSPLLDFGFTDMAFSGDVLIVGSYHGFNIYRLGADGLPRHLSSVVCPGGQGDVSIVGHLLIVSVEQTRGRLDCGLQGVEGDVSAERFRGLRIFDISDLNRPMQVGAVQTCRGSHTHSIVSGPDENGIITVYNSGTSSIREEEELAGCIDDSPGDPRTALFRIDVIEIPVDDPSQARVVASPTVFADPESDRLSGLWRGGDHGDDTQETSRTDHCHDITVYPSRKIAAGACSGNGILFDISDPLNPRRLDVVTDTGFAYWHSATFNNEGSKIIFTDEWGGGSRARCRAYDPLTWGADAIYDIVDGKLEFQGYFKMPAPQMEQENCVAHNGSIIPVPGRDLFVQAWYQGGLSVMDFTDSGSAHEIAYFDRGPIDAEDLVAGGFWSTYWYEGYIYGTGIVRGLDVLALEPSEYLSDNEIEAAKQASLGGLLNPQQQFSATWPSPPALAKAYLDQLERMLGETPELAAPLVTLLDQAARALQEGTADGTLAMAMKHMGATMPSDDQDAAVMRIREQLASVVLDIAGQLETTSGLKNPG